MKILSALIHGDRAGLQVFLEAETASAWHQACIDLIKDAPETADPEAAHSCFIEFGHRVREKVDDDRLLVSALRQLLAKFAGTDAGRGMVLYRGESMDRFQEGHIGLCWTTKRSVAEMFAGGLNAMIGQGGVLLQASAPGHALIAGPNAHSRWLGEEEYLVDPRLLQNIELVARYPNLWVSGNP